ncbi:ADP-ribosylation [Hyaloscypha variabilis]
MEGSSILGSDADNQGAVISRGRFVDLRSKEAEFFNRLLEDHVPDKVIRWGCYEHTGWVFEMEDAVVDIENTATDRVIVRVISGSIPRAYLDPLRQQLRHMLSTTMSSQGGVLEFAVTLLQLVETAVISVQDWRDGWRVDKTEGALRGWDVTTAVGPKVLFDNPLGADLTTIDDSAFHLLGKTVKELCAPLEDAKLRIIHVENVLRSDLVSRFKVRQQRMMGKLMQCSHHQLRQCVPNDVVRSGSAFDSRSNLARELCRPRATYHGTSRYNVSSIVRWGFALPGQKAGDKVIDVAFGSSFGRGIYTSPDARYALSYARWSENRASKTRHEDMPALRLIVCAVLMGRPLQVIRDATRRTKEISDDSADSHVSPNVCEYIVFDSAQVLPCYVVHLDFGMDAARKWLSSVPDDSAQYQKKLHPKLEKKDLYPGDVEALKQAKKAAASKWFPYGFGPATGTSFIIEEIGAVSDDEENYGEYQGQRLEVEEEMRRGEARTSKSGSWFDEYQNARKTKANSNKAIDNDDDD